MDLNKPSEKIKINKAHPLAKTLVFDVETRFMTIEHQSYQLKQYSDYLPHKSITDPVKLVCIAWRWLGDDHLSSVSVLSDPARFEQDPSDDYFVVWVLRELLDAADIAIGHNCVTPDTRILTSDLRHVPANELKLGDKLVGFDENIPEKGLRRSHAWFVL